MRWPFVTRRERLRREAADWIARLNGPHGEEDRAAFERWYSASPDHASAYDRLSALFQAAGNVSRAARPVNSAAKSQGVPLAAPSLRIRRRGRVRGARWPSSSCPRGPFRLSRNRGSSSPPFPRTAGESRRASCSLDGSEVLLSPGSRLEVAIGGDRTPAPADPGEGRFGVAREARPFIVEASGAEVVARGTVFVVQPWRRPDDSVADRGPCRRLLSAAAGTARRATAWRGSARASGWWWRPRAGGRRGPAPQHRQREVASAVHRRRPCSSSTTRPLARRSTR